MRKQHMDSGIEYSSEWGTHRELGRMSGLVSCELSRSEAAEKTSRGQLRESVLEEAVDISELSVDWRCAGSTARKLNLGVLVSGSSGNRPSLSTRAPRK